MFTISVVDILLEICCATIVNMMQYNYWQECSFWEVVIGKQGTYKYLVYLFIEFTDVIRQQDGMINEVHEVYFTMSSSMEIHGQ